MIFTTKPSLKLLVDQICKRLSSDGIKIKKQHVYESVAHSQGFSTDAAFRVSFPILLDTSNEAERILIEKFNLFNIDSIQINKSNYLSDAKAQLSDFPLISGIHQVVKIVIDVENGYISSPFIDYKEPSNYQSKYTEEFNLSAIVDEQEFNHLLNEIKMLINSMNDDDYIPFPSRAKSTLEQIEEVTKYFDYNINANEGYNPPAYFGDMIEVPTDDYDSESFEVIYNNKVVVNHESSNIDIRKTIASEFTDTAHDLNQDDLYYYLCSMRDECITVVDNIND